mgnify:CR=1 FL=1
MSNIDIIRAWKDEEYRNSLSEAERSQLPENPAGLVELPDEATEKLAGGKYTEGVGCKGTTAVSNGVTCDLIRIIFRPRRR